jgi:AcrR family transcriptional regulator
MNKQTESAVEGRRTPGRPRSEKARMAVIRSTLVLITRVGFHDLTIEAVAAHAGVGKATIYRWWPNKADLVIAAFVSAVGEELSFPDAGPVLESIHQQMKRWVPIFRSRLGQMVATVIGAGQSQPEMLKAFQRHWVEPRRVEARRLLRRAMEDGTVRSDIDPDTALDLLYGPLYLRLLIRHAQLDSQFVDSVFRIVSPALRARNSSRKH